jgi:hypothetical protein
MMTKFILVIVAVLSALPAVALAEIPGIGAAGNGQTTTKAQQAAVSGANVLLLF